MVEHRGPTESVVGPTRLAPDSGPPKPMITRATELDDARLEEISRGFVERWRPQMKVYFIGLTFGVALQVVAQWGARAGLWSIGMGILANLPLLALTPFIMWKQKRLQNEEAERVGVSPKLLTQLWRRQFLMGFRPRMMADVLKRVPKAIAREHRQHEMVMTHLRHARDEVAAREQKLLETARPTEKA